MDRDRAKVCPVFKSLILSASERIGNVMNVFFKLLTGRTITLDVDTTDSVIIVKKRLEKVINESYFRVRLVYAGKTLENERTLGDYNISSDSTIHIVLRMDSPYDPEYYPLSVFEEIQEIVKRKKGSEKKKLQISSNIHFGQILFPRENGPLIKILSFLDPFYLLFLRRICKSVRLTVHFMISENLVSWTDDHLFILFGRREEHAGEELFLKLSSIADFFTKTHPFIFTAPPKYVQGSRFKENLITICIRHGYFKGLRWLMEKGIRNRVDQKECLDVDYLGLALRLKRTTTECKFIIFHLELSCCSQDFSEPVWNTYRMLLEMIDQTENMDDLWDSVMTLLEKSPIPNRQVFLQVFCEFLSSTKRNVLGTLEKWLKVEKYFSEFSCVHHLNACLGSLSMEWRLLEYLITDFREKFIKANGSKKFVVTPKMAERKEFVEFLCRGEEQTKFISCYRPRFILHPLCWEGEDVSKFREVLVHHPYHQEEDIHFCGSSVPRLLFPFHQVKNLDILRELISIMPIFVSQYVQAVDSKNYLLADLMESKVLDFSADLAITKCCHVNFRQKRYDVMLKLLKSLDASDKLQWGDQNVLDDLKDLLLNNLSQTENEVCYELVQIFLSRQKTLEISRFYSGLFKLIRGLNSENKIVEKKRAEHILEIFFKQNKRKLGEPEQLVEWCRDAIVLGLDEIKKVIQNHPQWTEFEKEFDEKRENWTIRVMMKTLTGKSYWVDAKLSWTVERLKQTIERTRMSGIPVEQMRIIHAGKQMQESFTLFHYDMKDGAICHLVLRLRF